MNIIIFHGNGGTPQSFWFPCLKQKLSELGHIVFVPQLPQAETPSLTNWLQFVLKNFTYDSETILVGHSSGCPLILSVLENLNLQVKKAILVAGFAEPLNEKEEFPILQKIYDIDERRRTHGL